jgi:hypothetical protein
MSTVKLPVQFDEPFGGDIPEITAGIARVAGADYWPIELGGPDEKIWHTSRLFLLAGLLERSRVFRCIAFTERDCFIGAASARDVRIALGTRFPEYERALFAAFGKVASSGAKLRGEPFSEEIITRIVFGFLQRQQKGWELADWMNAGMVITLLRGSLDRGTVTEGSHAIRKDKLGRVIIRQSGNFVALVDQGGHFQGLCDRWVTIETLARDVVAQTPPE